MFQSSGLGVPNAPCLQRVTAGPNLEPCACRNDMPLDLLSEMPTSPTHPTWLETAPGGMTWSSIIIMASVAKHHNQQDQKHKHHICTLGRGYMISNLYELVTILSQPVNDRRIVANAGE